MKYHMIVAALISLSGLNAMVPDVTKWQEICKDPEKKQQLTTMYKDFCQKRIKNNFVWTVGSFTPLLLKSVRKNIIPVAFCGLFGARQTYLLGRNTYRGSLADQEDLSYLNNDVLEQLGNPNKRPYSGNASSFEVRTYKDGGYQKSLIGTPMGTLENSHLDTDNIDGIRKALSGGYLAYTGFPNDETLKVTAFKIRQNIEAMRS